MVPCCQFMSGVRPAFPKKPSLSRAQRLLNLIQTLHRHRRAVAGAVLAEELGVSLRTLYRDIETLKAQGADIDGEVGVGYVLAKIGAVLPDDLRAASRPRG